MSPNIISDPYAVSVKRALISVSNKENIVSFAQGLARFGVEILSTGGTAKLLKDAGIQVQDVSDFTGLPEMMDGRVKTLHPKVHGSILARRDCESHVQAMEAHNIPGIDMVVVNLYPFVETVKGGKDFNACIENIDIGGPAMVRAAAKNHDFVTVVTDPQDYNDVLQDMESHEGAVTQALRMRLAATAFCLTATYDSNIAGWIVGQMDQSFGYPRRISFSGTRRDILRYGENPHQTAALYTVDGDERVGVATATQIQGKALSYNNLNDTDAAFELVSEFDRPAVAIIKHANPCGVAMGKTITQAYQKALRCDPVSAFGGIVAINRPLDHESAKIILETFVEVIIAPSIESDAIDILKTKKNVRVLTTGAMPDVMQRRRMMKPVAGGFLVQDIDTSTLHESDLNVVTDREPTKEELRDLLFAARVAKHVKSNAIVYAKDGATAGIGAGQMSRVDSARIAAWKAQEASKAAGLEESLAKGSVVASDAFFPFADGLISAAEAGVTAVIQPGGSIRDQEVIDAANERGLAMVFTGIRNFRH